MYREVDAPYCSKILNNIFSPCLKMGHDLYYVGGRPKGGIAETFFRLFEEFPKSQEFFAKSVTF